MSSCQPQRYELLPNCNVWIAILIYGGETKEPLALLGEAGQGVIGVIGDYYIRYKINDRRYWK